MSPAATFFWLLPMWIRGDVITLRYDPPLPYRVTAIVVPDSRFPLQFTMELTVNTAGMKKP